MNNNFYILILAVGLLTSACSPSKNSDTENEMKEDSQDSNGSIAESASAIDVSLKFDQEITLQGITFTVSANNQKPINSVRLATSGLQSDGEPQTIEIAGVLLKAEAEDMNSDGSPEVILFFNSYDSIPEEFAIGFSVNNMLSMSRVSIPPLTPEQEQGYRGGGDMAIVETKLVRRFPIYEKEGTQWVKTNKMRQMQYSLKEGEAMRQFVLDKTLEY